MIFDHLAIDEVNRALSVQNTASGKSINVGRVLHTLGEDSFSAGFAGGDAGRTLRRELESAGIPCAMIETAAPTRTCITLIDQSNKTATELVEEAGPVTPAEITALFQAIKDCIASAEMLILSGSLAPGVAPDFYAQCCRLAAEANAITIVDARGGPLLLALREKPFLIKPNRAELSASIGMPVADDAQVIAAIGALMERPDAPQWAVITMGKDGAIASDGKAFWRIGTVKIEAISAVGSGDAFTAGLAAGIHRGQTVPEACRLATACGAANALIPGSGLLRLEDVKRLQNQVEIHQIE